MKAKKKYVNGLDKLAFAESQVSCDKYGTENGKCLSNAGFFLEKSKVLLQVLFRSICNSNAKKCILPFLSYNHRTCARGLL